MLLSVGHPLTLRDRLQEGGELTPAMRVKRAAVRDMYRDVFERPLRGDRVMTTRHRMSNADAAWLRMDSPTNLMIINSVLLFDEPLSLERVERVLQERIVDHFPRFRQRVVNASGLGGPSWEDDEVFDMRSHLHRMMLPAPGDDGALQELMGDLMSASMDPQKPLWQAYLVDGYRDGCALVMRMHHCIADGIALARVMMMLTDEHAGDFVEGAHHRSTPLDAVLRPVGAAAGAAGAAGRLLLHEGTETILHPDHLRDLASGAARDAGTLVKLLASPPDVETPLKGDLGVARRIAWTRRISLQRVKDIGHAHHATVNDVLVSALAGAIGHHVDARQGHADEIHAMVPFNLRPLDAPLEESLGNRFGLILLALPIGIEDPAVRLREVRARMLAIKRSHEGQMAYGVLSIMGLAPAAVESRLLGMFSSKATLVCTNVPGPSTPVTVDGVPIRDVLVWAPTSGSVGLGVSIFSYRGHIVAGFMAAESVLSDPADLARAFEAEVSALQHAEPPAARR
jgi:diacylglycerol O-acyltransferase / wax synthase